MANPKNEILDNFLQESIPIWRKNPVVFFREVLDFEPDDWQRKAAMDLAKNPKVSVEFGQGVGKNWYGSRYIFMVSFLFPVYPRVVATAPTKQQLHDVVLWSEISKWMGNSPLLGQILTWTKTYVYMKGESKRWFGVARRQLDQKICKASTKRICYSSWMRLLV